MDYLSSRESLRTVVRPSASEICSKTESAHGTSTREWGKMLAGEQHMEHYENTISTRRIHEGRIINLREDTVEMPSGRTAKREIVEHKGAVSVVPVLDDGRSEERR